MRQTILSEAQRDSLRALTRYVKSTYGLTSQALAERSHLKAHVVRNFLSEKKSDPNEYALVQLFKYLWQAHLKDGAHPNEIVSHVHLFSEFGVGGTPQATLINIKSLFPDVSPAHVHEVPENLPGTYAVYRYAAVGGEIIRAKLVIENHGPLPRFTNWYQDSQKRPRTTIGYVLNTGSSLHLFGHVAPTSALKLIVFDEPAVEEVKTLHGLTISTDFKNRHFASRCIAIRTSPSTDVPDDPMARDPETGVFSEIEKLRASTVIKLSTCETKLLNNFGALLSNETPENKVLYLRSHWPAYDGTEL